MTHDNIMMIACTIQQLSCWQSHLHTGCGTTENNCHPCYPTVAQSVITTNLVILIRTIIIEKQMLLPNTSVHNNADPGSIT